MPETATPAAIVLTEDVITIDDAVKILQKTLKKHHHKSTVGRWMMRGVNGVKLDHARVGRNLFTSTQAITRFIESLSK